MLHYWCDGSDSLRSQMAIVDKLLFGTVVMTVPASQEAMIWINVG
jgi:hypothetical protein